MSVVIVIIRIGGGSEVPNKLGVKKVSCITTNISIKPYFVFRPN